MICSELMSNKFDFNKLSWIEVKQAVLVANGFFWSVACYKL